MPRAFVLICLLALLSSLTKTQPASIPVLNLSPLYNCSQPRHLGIFRFPSLSNCFHNMLQQEATILTFWGEVLRYCPVATTFPIYYCTLKTIQMTCHYDNIFTGKSWYHKAKSVLLPNRSCLQAAIDNTIRIGHLNKTLTKVSNNHWKIPLSPT